MEEGARGSVGIDRQAQAAVTYPAKSLAQANPVLVRRHTATITRPIGRAFKW